MCADDKLVSEALGEKEISGGVVHDLPADLKKALTSDARALETWEDIRPLARNEWICWIESAKKAETKLAGSNGAVPASKRESGDPGVGLAVRIAEIIAIGILDGSGQQSGRQGKQKTFSPACPGSRQDRCACLACEASSRLRAKAVL